MSWDNHDVRVRSFPVVVICNSNKLDLIHFLSQPITLRAYEER